ncbi:heavy metal-binding domain-containing protein [Streptomyces vinaceus]|uniref:heavy metal-binding domain-containing protein n=1 Tax=Streptomyces vinaceus TaxID=1960 RepID=UPI0036CC9877
MAERADDIPAQRRSDGDRCPYLGLVPVGPGARRRHLRRVRPARARPRHHRLHHPLHRSLGLPGCLVRPARRRLPPKPSRWAPSYEPLVRAPYSARKRALARAVDECRALGGDGIVGVSMDIDPMPLGGLECTVRGTAVRARSRIRPHQPFSSHLGGQDFARLIHSA